MTVERKFPNTRLRRLRKNLNLIDLVSETNLTSKDLIQPIFIKENFKFLFIRPVNLKDTLKISIDK